jgi:3-oxoisoapionate kinase
MTGLKLVWYGDDFTGATDTLATAAQAGLRSLLFLGVPTAQQLTACGPLDCLGIAGASRSMAPAAMHDELQAVGRLFAALAPPVLHYKVCSTFDSSPTIGSIGAAVHALKPFVSNPLVAIVGGQPSLGRYCLFSHLFARAGSDGDIHRIDRHPTMRQHPVTPMGEADLRLHLSPQGLAALAAIAYPAYDDTAQALDQRVDQLLQTAPDAVLFDVSRCTDLGAIGRQIWLRARQQPLLAVGASSVVQALAAHWADAARSPAEADATGSSPATPSTSSTPPVPRAPRAPLAPARGPVLVLAGSLSPQTALQVRQARAFTSVALDPHILLAEAACDATAGTYGAEQAAMVTALLRAGKSVLVDTSGTAPAALTQTPAKDFDPAALASVCGAWLNRLLQQCPVNRLGIAGGDTSSHAVQALGAWGLSYLRPICPGVALCRLHSDAPHLDGMELALKGGQMGPPDYFELLRNGD